jgi:hypothetical protein
VTNHSLWLRVLVQKHKKIFADSKKFIVRVAKKKRRRRQIHVA